MSKKAYTVIVIDNETGETNATVESDVVIIASVEVKEENALTVHSRLYRSGSEITPQDVIDAACTLPEYIKQAVRKAERKGMKK